MAFPVDVDVRMRQVLARPWVVVRVSPAFEFEPNEAVKYDADVRIEGVCPNGSLQKNG